MNNSLVAVRLPIRKRGSLDSHRLTYTRDHHVRIYASTCTRAVYAGDLYSSCTMEAGPGASCTSPSPEDSPSPGGSSTWTESLKQVGVYFEGIVDDADTVSFLSTQTQLSLHMEPEHLE